MPLQLHLVTHHLVRLEVDLVLGGLNRANHYRLNVISHRLHVLLYPFLFHVDKFELLSADSFLLRNLLVSLLQRLDHMLVHFVDQRVP